MGYMRGDLEALAVVAGLVGRLGVARQVTSATLTIEQLLVAEALTCWDLDFQGSLT